MKRWAVQAAAGAASWVLARAADVLLGKAVTSDPWPATTRDRRDYPDGIEGLEQLQRDLNVDRELRRAYVRRLGECPNCGPVCICAPRLRGPGWRL